MEIKCTNCEVINLNQRFCGNCGTQLLYLPDEVARFSRSVIEPKRKSKAVQWGIGIVAFLLIWSVGSALIGIVLASAKLDDKYAGLFGFFLGLLVMVLIGVYDPDKDIIDEEDVRQIKE